MDHAVLCTDILHNLSDLTQLTDQWEKVKLLSTIDQLLPNSSHHTLICSFLNSSQKATSKKVWDGVIPHEMLYWLVLEQCRLHTRQGRYGQGLEVFAKRRAEVTAETTVKNVPNLEI